MSLRFRCRKISRGSVLASRSMVREPIHSRCVGCCGAWVGLGGGWSWFCWDECSMKTRVELAIAVQCVVALWSVLEVGELRVWGADWPQWRGVERTGHVTGEDALLTKLPTDAKVIWRRPLGDGFASPVVAGDRVIISEDREGREVVHALDARTGERIWSVDIDSSHRDGFGIGPRCTPVMDGGLVYVQSAKGELRCLALEDGKTVWRTSYVEDFGALYIGEKGKAVGASRHGASGSPLVHGGLLIAQVGSVSGAGVVAFDKQSGAVVWKSQDDQSAYAGLFLARLAGRLQVLSFTAEGLIGLAPEDGKLLWRVPLKTALGRHVTTPVVADDLVLVASHQVGLVATRVKASGEGFEASEAWVNKGLGFNFSSPVVLGGHLFGLAPGKRVVCVALKTGAVAWEQEGLVQSSSDRAEAAFLVFGERVLMLNDTGELVLFAGESAKYREDGRVQVCGKNWCSPAYSNGRLYVRDAQEIVCVGLR